MYGLGQFVLISQAESHVADVRNVWNVDRRTARSRQSPTSFHKKLLAQYGKEKGFIPRKDDGKIMFQGAPLCTSSVEPDNAKMQWNLNAVRASGVDQVAMSTLFRFLFCIEWSS